MSRKLFVAIVLVAVLVVALAAPLEAGGAPAQQAHAAWSAVVGRPGWMPVQPDGGCETGGAGGCPIQG